LTINHKDIVPEFKSQVASTPGGELVKYCFDCGTCSGVCPVSESGTGFDPRKIIHMVKMGLKNRLLSSQVIWQCTHCDTCAFVCPQNVEFSSIVDALRLIAIKEKYVDSNAVDLYGTAPCKAACPAHISIPGFIHSISQGRFKEGLQLIKREMPFPAICGRICPHPCEIQCNRSVIDKPVAIEFLKRFLGDLDVSSGSPYAPQKKAERPEKVAVVGSGPAGLTVAYYLAIEGFEVTILEKHPVAGGMMAVGIPAFRLPREILRAEIECVERLGVDFRLNFEVGKDCSFNDLTKDFKAVFIGIGCDKALKLGLPGEDQLNGIVDGLTFLRNLNLGILPDPKDKLVVIGGGNTAIDCARVAKRLGYGAVSILYRRTRDEMPANAWEIDDTLEEGIDIQYLTAPVRILSQNGDVSGLECIRMKLDKPDESGRRRPIPVENSEFQMKTDVILPAIGQIPHLEGIFEKSGIDISHKGLLKADSLTGATDIEGVFTGGDVVYGPRTVVEAVASGKKAAMYMSRYLKGEAMSEGLVKTWKGVSFAPKDVGHQEREAMPQCPLVKRTTSFQEIDLGFTEEKARAESHRCLRICGIQNPT
jgi:NADPH-dependent glutamate synthase beta subunit-like oxidoreductase